MFKIKKEIIYTTFAILACVMWATAFVGIKFGYRFMDAPFTFAGLRFILAGLILMPFAYYKSSFIEFKENIKLIIFIAFMQTFISYAIFYFALTFVGGAVAAITIGSGPVVVATMSHFMMEDEKMTRKKMLTLLSGLMGIGMVILSTKPMTSIGLKESFGIVLLLCSSSIMGFINIKVAKYKKGINPVMLNSKQMFLGGIFLYILGNIADGGQNYILSPIFYLALLWLAVVSAFGFSIWFYLLSKEETKVSELNMWKFIIPVVGAVLAWIIIPEESPNIQSLMGMILIVLSFIFYYR